MPTLEVILLALVYESTVAGINSDMIWQEFSWPMGFDIKTAKHFICHPNSFKGAILHKL